MKAKSGYKNQKGLSGDYIGKWLKYYFKKRTCKKNKKVDKNDEKY